MIKYRYIYDEFLKYFDKTSIKFIDEDIEDLFGCGLKDISNNGMKEYNSPLYRKMLHSLSDGRPINDTVVHKFARNRILLAKILNIGGKDKWLLLNDVITENYNYSFRSWPKEWIKEGVKIALEEDSELAKMQKDGNWDGNHINRIIGCIEEICSTWQEEEVMKKIKESSNNSGKDATKGSKAGPIYLSDFTKVDNGTKT